MERQNRLCEMAVEIMFSGNLVKSVCISERGESDKSRAGPEISPLQNKKNNIMAQLTAVPPPLPSSNSLEVRMEYNYLESICLVIVKLGS